MAVGTTAAIMLAGGTFAATSQYMAGQQQAAAVQRQAEYNAAVYEQQAEMIQQKKKLEAYQYDRRAGQIRGAITAKTAGKGLMLSGSPLAILADSESQIQLDRAIGQYNLDVQKQYAGSGAQYYRATGAAQSRLAKFAGVTGAFSTALQTGTQLGMLNLLPGQGITP